MKFDATSMSFQILLTTLFVLQASTTIAFLLPSLGQRTCHVHGHAPLTLRAQIQSDDGTFMNELRAMSVADIKRELSSLKTPFNDVFEKEGLIRRLHDARTKTSNTRTTPTATATSATNTKSNRDVLQAPLYFTSLDTNVRIAAVNVQHGGITVNPAEKPYPTIKIQVPSGKTGQSFTLTLLLDTACSGLVLRPNIVAKHSLPSYKNPVSMTGAGGVAGTAGLTQLETFTLADATFGPMPAAVQDIGGLPRDLDGIIGLSFLSQFAGIEMDFRRGVVSFFKSAQAFDENNNDNSNNNKDDSKTMTVLAEADMELVPRLGIYTVEVMLGGRGPIKMLVDSGAASSFLNWKGVADLGLERSSPAIVPIQGSMGAMGSDNMAIQLTHRIGVSSTLNLGRSPSSSSYPGISLQDARLPIDIGQIPILDRVHGAGGILGVDALMRSAIVRFSFKGRPRITFLN